MYDKNYYLVAINPWYRAYYNKQTGETIHISKEQYEEYQSYRTDKNKQAVFTELDDKAYGFV